MSSTSSPITSPTVSALTARALARHPHRVAFSWDGGTLTYAHTAALIGGIQAAYATAGLSRGACIGVLAGNRAESWCAIAAAQAMGMRTTPLHPMGSLADHRFQLGDAGVDALVVDPDGFGERGAALADDIDTVFALDPAGFGRDLLAAAADIGAAPARDVSRPDDIAIINYTGGTTGRPKGVMRRQRHLGASTAAILADFELPVTPRYLAAAPISHVAGSKVLPTLWRGGTVHLQQGFDPSRLVTTVAAERINMALLVPTMIYGLLDHADDLSALSSLELLLYGASPMSPSRLREGLERIGPVFSQLYGQTECYPVAVLARADHDVARPELFSACGHPIASCQVALLDADNNEVPQGEPGEICVRAPHVMEEYWQRPDTTAETFAGGWLHTSDIARRDEEGRLFIVDRKKDMIISGGFNIYPKEIEDVLTAHPGVAQAAVIGIPDEKWGEAVTAVIVRRGSTDATADELTALVREQKGRAHAPKRVDFVDALPLTAVGKVDKKVLRQPYWDAADRQVG
ncbi:MAG: AMP-binding protein [Desertimonas sp.]